MVVPGYAVHTAQQEVPLTKAPPRKDTNQELQLRAAHAAQDWQRVAHLCRQTLRKNKRSLLAHRYLGYALKMLGQIGPAIDAYLQATTHHRDDAELLANYTNLLLEQAMDAEALPLLDKLCALRPTDSSCWSKVAQACYKIGLHEKGFGSAMVAYSFAQNDYERAAALLQRAIHRRELGQIHQAVEDCTEAIAINPTDASHHTNRLLFMLGDPQTSPEQLATAAKEYGAIFEAPHKPYWPTYEERRGEPWRKLKVGFLSPDFRVHAVMCFAEGLLAQLDRRQFEVYAFYLYPKDDLVTERVKCHVDHFIRIAHLGYDEQAKIIQSHAIDILIDMTGHTGGNALLTMARKPAPIQVTWIGFVATTGLSAIDYYLTDEIINPAGVDHLFSEKLWRLKTFHGSYRAMSRNPLWSYQPLYAVRPTPALRNGYITFGSCNNLGKLTDEVLTLWGKLLQIVPKSRLLIEGKGFNKPEFAKNYRSRCESLGVDIDRLNLVPLVTEKQYLTYHDIDIALDPFPLTGGTTTCDLLWMGVPLVSMVGNSSPSRMSTNALTYTGHEEWLAHSHDEYLTIAARLASSPEELNHQRLRQREEVEQSPLMRDDIFCENVAQAFRLMWMAWLAEKDHPEDQQAQYDIIEKWYANRPEELVPPPTLGVGITEGQRLSLHTAHQELQALLEKALQEKNPNTEKSIDGKMSPHWIAVTEYAEKILCAVPNDAVALACLAEVEHAHGHTDFALTYLQYASKAISIIQISAKTVTMA